MADFKIILPRNKRNIAGDTVEGSLVVKVNEPIIVKNITMRIIGETVTRMYKRRPARWTTPAYHTDRNIFYELLMDIFKPDFEESAQFNADEYSYPFSICLPAWCPGSIKGPPRFVDSRGKFEVNYWFEVVLNWFDDAHQTIRPVTKKMLFQVLEGCAPASFPPWVLKPCERNLQLELKRVCCTSGGLLYGNVNLDSLCFCAGESLKIQVQLKNTSGHKFYGLHTSLLQTVEYSQEYITYIGTRM